MKWESSDLWVGTVVVTAILIVAAALLWLSPAIAQRTYAIWTEFEDASGIAEQSPVNLRGFAIGRVGSIRPRIDDAGNLRFRVRLDIRWRLASGDSLYVYEGTRARLVPPPMIGNGYIVLELPERLGRRLEPGAEIPGMRTGDMLGRVQALTSDTGMILQTVATTRVLLDSLVRAVGLANNMMVQVTGQVPPIMQQLHAQFDLAQALTEDLRTQVSTISPMAVASIDTATMLLADSRRLVLDLNRLLAAREPEIGGILANLDSTTLLLHHFVRQVSARPWKMLTGVQPPAGLNPPAATKASGNNDGKKEETPAPIRP
ncbi:MAG: MCE family protein [Gemmatimonadetes bacterium]|nr:MCE family protein [Gemmatimonadota bacterium]